MPTPDGEILIVQASSFFDGFTLLQSATKQKKNVFLFAQNVLLAMNLIQRPAFDCFLQIFLFLGVSIERFCQKVAPFGISIFQKVKFEEFG